MLNRTSLEVTLTHIDVLKNCPNKMIKIKFFRLRKTIKGMTKHKISRYISIIHIIGKRK